MRTLLRKFSHFHWLLILNLLALVTWGVWVMYNACSWREDGRLAVLWRTQAQWAVVGMAGFGIASVVDYKWLRWGAGVCHLAIVAIILFQFRCEGATCWWEWLLDVGIFTVSLPILILMSTVLVLAVVLGGLSLPFPLHRTPLRHDWGRVLVAGAIACVSMALSVEMWAMAQFWALGAVLALMLLVASIRWRTWVVIVLLGLCVLPLWYSFHLEQEGKTRVDEFVQMLTHQEGGIIHERAEHWDRLIIAVGSAGMAGKGPLSESVGGGSVHRTFFHPGESIHGLIFGVMVEEFGCLGGLLQIGMMTLLVLWCVQVAHGARDELGRLVATGVGALFFVTSWQHMGANVLMLPFTKQSLPFVSYGEAYVMECLFLMGVVHSVWVHGRISQKSRPNALDEAESGGGKDAAGIEPGLSQADALPH